VVCTLLHHIQDHSGWLAVANQLHVEPETRYRFQRPPYCGVYPLVSVAKGVTAKLSEEHRIRYSLARVEYSGEKGRFVNRLKHQCCEWLPTTWLDARIRDRQR
jgi:hypothetical protein